MLSPHEQNKHAQNEQYKNNPEIGNKTIPFQQAMKMKKVTNCVIK